MKSMVRAFWCMMLVLSGTFSSAEIINQERRFGRGIGLKDGSETILLVCTKTRNGSNQSNTDDDCLQARFKLITPTSEQWIGKTYSLDVWPKATALEEAGHLYQEIIPTHWYDYRFSRKAANAILWPTIGVGLTTGVALAAKGPTKGARYAGVAMIPITLITAAFSAMFIPNKKSEPFKSFSGKKYKKFFDRDVDSWQFRELEVSKSAFNAIKVSILMPQYERLGLSVAPTEYSHKDRCSEKLEANIDQAIALTEANTPEAKKELDRLSDESVKILESDHRASCIYKQLLQFDAFKYVQGIFNVTHSN